MTFVGKVLVAVQLVLSVCLMAFAAAVSTAQSNWYVKAREFEDQAKTVQANAATASQEAQTSLTERDAKIAELTGQSALLSGKLTAAEEERARLQTEVESARAAADGQTAVANLAAEQATARQEEALRVRQQNDLLHNQVHDLLVQSRGLEDEVFARNLSIEQMKSRQASLIGQVEKLRGQLASIAGTTNSGGTLPTGLGGAGDDGPPDVTGQVLEIQKSPTSKSEFVIVSLGSDDGFRKGNELFLYRGDQYLGKITLVSVTPDRAVGRVTQRTRNGVIQKGDHATSKL